MIEEILVDSNEEILNNEQETVEDICQENIVNKEDKYVCKNNMSSKFDNVLFNRKTKVYAKVNEQGYVINVQSDVVLEDTSGWIQIDEGSGDRFVFAHTEYFGRPLTDEFGNYQIKFDK